MNKKLKFLIIPLVGLGLVAGTAVPVLARSHAQSDSPPAVSQASDSKKSDRLADASKPHQDVVKGTVQSVSGNTITLTSGTTINVDSATKYTAPGKPVATLADVVKDAEVVAQVRDSGAGPVAVGVHVLGDMEKRSWTEGTVTAYTAGSSITINDEDGNPATFVINADTKINYPKDITTIIPGNSVKVASTEDAAGTTLTATMINVEKLSKEVRNSGVVTAYTAGSSITINDLKGNPATFVINADTKINYPEGITSIVLGDSVNISGTRGTDGTTLTANVINVQVKRVVEGTVTALTADSITVKPATGDSVTAKLGADTVYTIKGKSGVAVGDAVTLIAERQSDGTLLARSVFDGVKAPAPKDQGEHGAAGARGNPEKMTPKFTPPGPAPKANHKD